MELLVFRKKCRVNWEIKGRMCDCVSICQFGQFRCLTYNQNIRKKLRL
jgi:hypothetical protein